MQQGIEAGRTSEGHDATPSLALQVSIGRCTSPQNALGQLAVQLLGQFSEAPDEAGVFRRLNQWLAGIEGCVQ